MTIFEILNFNKELLRRLSEIGVKVNDYKYVDIYIDYHIMSKGGDKKTYIVAKLAEKYKMSERKVYSIISRLGNDCKNCTT